ncbi:MAG: hypothetical protein ACYDD4_01755 [Acidimicrobiales bacterium]
MCIADPATKREITIYLTWRHARNLAVRAEAGRLSAAAANSARDQTDAAVRFLAFVAQRGRRLAELEQHDVDAFFAEAPNPRMALDFLTFAMAHRRCPKLRLPPPQRVFSAGSPSATISELVRRLLVDETLVLADRVAGLLVVLMAQPVTRVAGLRLGDVTDVDGTLVVCLGPDPLPLPAPVAALVSRYLGERSNMTTTNTDTDYLFPGGRPGSHMTAAWLTKRLNQLGITKLARQGALSHLVAQAPAAVVARATGYSFAATTLRAAVTGSDWAHYAALKSAGGA